MTTRTKLSLIAAALVLTGTAMTAAGAGSKTASTTIKTATEQPTETSAVSAANPEATPNAQSSVTVKSTAPALKVVSDNPLTVEADPNVPDPTTTPEATPTPTPEASSPPAPKCLPGPNVKPGICVSN